MPGIDWSFKVYIFIPRYGNHLSTNVANCCIKLDTTFSTFRLGPGFGLENVTCTASIRLNRVRPITNLRGSLHHLTKTKSNQFYCTFHVSRLEEDPLFIIAYLSV